MILHCVKLARPADPTPIDDITTLPRGDEPARWVTCPDHPSDCLLVPFEVEPSEAEQTAIRRRLVTINAADEQRLYDLLSARETATSTFERLWLDTELARYGEPTDVGSP